MYACVCVCVYSYIIMPVCPVISNSFWPHGLLICQAPQSMGFSKQEYWSGLPFPPPGDLPDPGIEPTTPFFLYCWWILYCLSHKGSLYIHKIKEGREPKNWCLHTVVLEKIPESLLNNKEIKTVNHKRNYPWILIGRTEAEAEAPVFWSPDVNSQLTGKVPGTFCWEGLRAEREEGFREWDGWMASSIQWMWTWANFRRWWETGRPGVLQSMGLQRIRHDWTNEQQIK